jgi:omega-6 fatty acid desaturase (delta-12 desaturase)
MTGVWVLAHECGHQSFSESELVNNTVGTICHSLLLVPFHPWRITHGKHHNNTGSCENDEVFAPSTRSDWGLSMLRETPLAHLWGIVLMLTVGWMPGYLVFNATGPGEFFIRCFVASLIFLYLDSSLFLVIIEKYRGKNANHFSPTAEFFRPEDYNLVVQSDIAFFMALGLFFYSIFTFGTFLLLCILFSF